MPTPVLPAYAKIAYDGFSITRQSAVIRSDMESGPPKQARTLSRVLVTRAVTFLFDSKANYSAFIVWFRDELVRGAEWFTWVDPVDDASKLARIVGGALESEEPHGTMKCWRVRCKLETWDA